MDRDHIKRLRDVLKRSEDEGVRRNVSESSDTPDLVGFGSFDEFRTYVNSHQRKVSEEIELLKQLINESGIFNGLEPEGLPDTWCELYLVSRDIVKPHVTVIFIPPLRNEIEKSTVCYFWAALVKTPHRVIFSSTTVDFLMSFVTRRSCEI